MDETRFKTLVAQLASTAREKEKKKVDASFAVELQHYTQHVGVRVLDDEETELVIKAIVGDAMSRPGPLDGNAIRSTVNRRCRRAKGPYNVCAATALQILTVHDREDAAERLRHDLLQALEKYES